MTNSPKPMPKIVSSQPYFPADEIDWILSEMRAVLECGVLTRGNRIAAFEKLFADLIGVKHAIAVSNGTTALEIILRSYELNGDEVIVPTNTFLATANAVIFAAGLPVLRILIVIRCASGCGRFSSRPRLRSRLCLQRPS